MRKVEGEGHMLLQHHVRVPTELQSSDVNKHRQDARTNYRFCTSRRLIPIRPRPKNSRIFQVFLGMLSLGRRNVIVQPICIELPEKATHIGK
jgi:hypothetical protein